MRQSLSVAEWCLFLEMKGQWMMGMEHQALQKQRAAAGRCKREEPTADALLSSSHRYVAAASEREGWTMQKTATRQDLGKQVSIRASFLDQAGGAIQ